MALLKIPFWAEHKPVPFNSLGSMTDQEKHDHWGDLAADVGATTPPDRSPAQQPVDEIADAPDSETTNEVEAVQAENIEVVEVAPRKIHTDQPKSGWDQLATEFNLAPAEKPSQAKEEVLDTAPIEEEPAGVDESRYLVDEVEAEVSAEDISALDEVAVDETLDDNAIDVEQQLRREGPWLGVDEFDALFDDSPADDRQEETDEESEVPSFEDAIEAASQETEKEKAEEEKTSGRRRKKRRRRTRKTKPVEEGDEVAAEMTSTVDSGGFGAGLFEDTGRPSAAESPEGEAEEGGRKRGRRHCRRGSGKKKESVAEASVQEEFVSDDAADREDAENSRRGRSERKPEEDEKKAVSHRGIPTWDEAVESIIATNMENRSKKSGGASSSRSRGGRGRSGREKSASRKRSG